ncbi:MAG: HAMP domain-containing sensor histidine kinase [Hyphomicrobium sp.]|jgi:signal transduction histidine kinase
MGLAHTHVYLVIAAALHLVALVVSFATPGGADNAILIATGLLLILVALRLPHQSAARPEEAVLSPPDGHREAPIVAASAVVPFEPSMPGALPFIGERILLNSDHSKIARLARAAARLGQVTAARSYPWAELMARVSHELRTPLNAVIGFSDLMNAELFGPMGHPRYQEYARHIRDCGRELLKSAEDTLAITCLLDYDAAPSLDRPLDLGNLVNEAWLFYADVTAARCLSLQQSVPEGLELLTDRRPMRQILINLFAEAVQRAEDGGMIGLTSCADGDLVQIEVFVRGRPNDRSVGEASLAICLARALLELQGAALVEVDDPSSTWRALTVLRCAAQQDFFSVAPLQDRRPQHLC